MKVNKVNPRKRRAQRDNPEKKEAGAKGIALSFRQPMSLLMPVGVALGGFIATNKIPAMIGVTSPLSRFGVKAAVGFAGSMLIPKLKFLGKGSEAVWVIGSAINLLVDILNTYVFQTTPLTIAGMGAFPAGQRRYVAPVLSGSDVGEVGDLNAFPEANYPM
jgi:hypothetical protein